MAFSFVDWIAVVAYLLITLFLGLYFRGRSGKSTEDYFVSGRSVSWWLAGTSMVATTFAADTPLLVTGLVYRQRICRKLDLLKFPLTRNMTVILFCPLVRGSGPANEFEIRGVADWRRAGRVFGG